MWSDNETEKDYLNFTGVSETVAEIILQAEGRPISIGVSGAWGVGKSSMIKLIRSAVQARAGGDKSKFVFVEFNAWLYQGYDDARAALMDVIANILHEEAKSRKTALEKTQDLLKRVNWLRTAKLAATTLIPVVFGLPPVGAIGEVVDAAKGISDGTVTKEDIASAEGAAAAVGGAAASLWKSRTEASPPKEIQAIRHAFEEALTEMDVTLVVLIDDLDRCLPPTTISTLEAIRLFLFLKNTAFVIAADDSMIKHAVRQHFGGNVKDDLVINYFDKLIQVPIRVPPLGTQEVRAYLMLLFVENSTLKPEEKEAIRTKVCSQLSETWKGRRVDRAFMETVHAGIPPDLLARFDTAERLAPLMTTASQIAGNPRLIKRFLNALSIRIAIAKAHGVAIDEAALAKMLLFERCADPPAYSELSKAVNENGDGKPYILAEWEDHTIAGKEFKLNPPWDDSFIREWLRVPPRLADIDLRGILYVGREHAPLITPEDRLSSGAAELLAGLLQSPDMADRLKDRIKTIARPELAIMMDRVLAKAQSDQSWGAPPILNACLVIAEADPFQGARLAAFLRERPLAQITASIVPKIQDQDWSDGLFDHWSSVAVEKEVKRAIATARKQKNGNV